jgi:hypothetical protein
MSSGLTNRKPMLLLTCDTHNTVSEYSLHALMSFNANIFALLLSFLYFELVVFLKLIFYPPIGLNTFLPAERPSSLS